jgi:hypothetical protein
VEHLFEHPGTEDEERTRQRLEKAFNSLKKITEKLHARRKTLHTITGVKK